MTYKSYNPDSLQFFEDIGMRIPSLGECFSKFNIGAKMGLVNLASVFFGLYSVKLVNIPL